MSGLYARKRKRPEMNLVPLIDVLVMLIFFAFVTMQFRSAATLNVTLPKVETAGKTELRESLTITVATDGTLGMNGKPVTLDELRVLVPQVADISKDITVMLRADENAPLKHITEVMDLCRKHGLNRIRLMSR
ncbi:MAG TPA: biopolymer transporter ExbD [Opitutaceae bacterium]|nr:biopolymer transporter ExbD [Opitutaceae bacterium]